MEKLPHNLFESWDVLVVDDEEDSLEVARFILDFYGAAVHTASNGKQGLERLKRVHPKLIISDLSMPEMDGWEFLIHLKDDPTTRVIPVIALTAHAMLGDRERAIQAGFHSYISKPLTVNTFIYQLLDLLRDIPEIRADLRI